jgi:hypothetical protein
VKLQRAAGLTAFFVVGLATALHLALLAAWRFSIAPDLEQARFPEELSRNTIDLFPSPSADWAELSANGLHLRAPIREPAAAAISRCARRCQLPLAAGKLTIFAEALGETYEEQLLAMSPSREDVALLRAPWRNWRTIRSLAHHANMPNPLPPTERFASPATRGILTYFHSQGVDRWVIYAYAVRGMASQKLALSGASWEVLLTLLGSLRFAEES